MSSEHPPARAMEPADPAPAAELTPYIEVLTESVDQRAAAASIKPQTWQAFKGVIGELSEHSPVTYAHCLRVGRYAHDLASREQQEDLHFPLFAGCAHDVGKIGISRGTLEATGTFTHEQYLDIKRHAEIGFTILRNTHLYSAFIAGLHHKLKPEGYGIDLEDAAPFPLSPASIKKIESMARLIMLVDFFDALTTRKNDKGLATFGNETEQRETMRAHFPDSQMRIDWLFDNREPLPGQN